jgi:hypothetical protein
MGTMLAAMAPRLIRKPVTMTTVTLAVAHQLAGRVILWLTLHQMFQTKSFIGTTA